MGAKTGIEWTDATWNPVRGCSRVSEGCRNCYAERVAARFSGPGQPYEGLAKIGVRTGHHPKWTGEVRLINEHLADPLRWRKSRRVFVNSMSDLFHEKLTDVEIAAVFGVMAMAGQHTFQALTKRAARMRAWFDWIDGGADTPANLCRLHAEDALGAAGLSMPDRGRLGMYDEPPTWPLPNLWLGVSVENQEAADERIPQLLRTPAVIRFLSCEPLLGPINLRHRSVPCAIGEGCDCNGRHFNPHVDWVIAGCESGPGARPANFDWYRSLRDQCAAADAAFFLKQATDAIERCEHCREAIRYAIDDAGVCDAACGCTVEGAEVCNPVGIVFGPGSHRKAGGVIGAPYLDGHQHLAFPEVGRGLE